MATIDVQVTVSKETHELGIGMSSFVGSVKQALADGWQPGQDLPVIITSAVTDLVPSIQGVDQMDDEAKENPIAFANAIAVSLSKAAEHFVK